MIETTKHLPHQLRVFGASDYAVSKGEGDYTAHGVAGVDLEDNVYILDWWKDREEPKVWIDTLCDLILKWNPEDWCEEKGPILKSLNSFIELRMRERRAYVNRVAYAATVDKTARAQGIRGRMSQGKLFLPHRAPWLEELEAELLAFPAGLDDQVDVLSLMGIHLTEMTPAGHLRNFSPQRHVRKVS